MSSILVDAYQRAYEVVVAKKNLAIATPFTAMHLMQSPRIDMASEQVTIEVYKGNRKVAPLVSRQTGGIDVDNPVIRPGVVGANDYLFALASQDFELPAATLNKRIPEEPLYMPGATSEDIKMMRRAFWINDLALDATSRVIRRDELLAKQSVMSGEMDLGDTFQSATKLIFPRSAVLKNRTVTASWATAADAKPWNDIGATQKKIKELSQVDGRNQWVMLLPSNPMENLKAIYRSQRTNDAGQNLEYNDFRFDPEQGAPQEFAFMLENGCEYCGWIRSSYSTSKVHLLTIPEGYDATADDSGTSYTDALSGEVVILMLYSPEYFKAYFGPGKKDPPSVNLYSAVFPSIGMPTIPAAGLTIGASRIPTRTMLLNVYQLGRNEGLGGTIEHAPIFANVRPDVVATIATTTAG